MESLEVTEDSLMGGKVLLKQPVGAYRVAIDPIFLAAAVHAKPGDTVLDIGAGVGAASLCLARRLDGIKVIGLELQREYVRLAAENVKLNHLQDRVEILCGNLLKAPPRLAAGTFTHVMTNPPYVEHDKGRPSPNPLKRHANIEDSASFSEWANFCLLMVKPKGTITFIHRADRLDHILSFFAGKLGGIHIYPLWPGHGKAAKRVVVTGVKSSGANLTLHQGMLLHHQDGKFTREAEAILRDGESLVMG